MSGAGYASQTSYVQNHTLFVKISFNSLGGKASTIIIVH